MTATRIPPALALALLLWPAWSQAQSLGQFQWHLSPFCNVVTISVTQNGPIYTLDGFDNQCGGSSPRAPLVGVAALNPDGSIGFGLTIVTTPTAAPIHVRATIQLPQLHGTWSDSAGNTGDFRFGSTTQTTNPRPVPSGVVLPALSVAGSGTFGGPLSAPSLSVTGAGTFGGTVSASQLAASSAVLAGGLAAGSVSSTGSATFGGTVSGASLTSTGNATVQGALTASTISATGAAPAGGTLSARSLSVAEAGVFGEEVSAGSVLAAGTLNSAGGSVGIAQADAVSNTAQARLVLTRALGTRAAPLAVTADTNLGTLFWGGFDGSSTPNSALVAAFASEAWTPTARGTRIVFSTTANGTTALTARMRILDNGRVGINTTAPDQLLSVNGEASKVGGGSWLVFSDERLKTVHGTFTRGLSDLLGLQPIRYEYAPGNALGLEGRGEYVGFSAQAVQAAIPEAVSESAGGYLQLNSDPILWTMLNAIKELKGANDELAARNAALERRLTALEIERR